MASRREFRHTSLRVISAGAVALSVLLSARVGSAQTDARARARARGSDLPTAVAVAHALLAHPLDAQLTRVRCERLGRHRVCGLVLSGVKFKHPLDRTGFTAEVRRLIRAAFASAALEEVDLWTTVPLNAGKGVVVSGDLAAPTSATVFAISVPAAALAGLDAQLNTGRDVFWDSEFAASLAKGHG